MALGLLKAMLLSCQFLLFLVVILHISVDSLKSTPKDRFLYNFFIAILFTS